MHVLLRFWTVTYDWAISYAKSQRANTIQVKCDRGQPACGWCSRNGAVCEYKERKKPGLRVYSSIIQCNMRKLTSAGRVRAGVRAEAGQIRRDPPVSCPYTRV